MKTNTRLETIERVVFLLAIAVVCLDILVWRP
jgi:hypothetical protein